MYDSYDTPAAQDYQLANQAPGPCRTTEELMRIFRKGRGQTLREELHGYRPFGSRTRSLQSRIQKKLKRTKDYDKSMPILIIFCHSVRHNLAMHRSVTPFIIWQPICRHHLLERVYKPLRTPH